MSTQFHPLLAAYGLIFIECAFWVVAGYLLYKRKQKKKSIWDE